MSETFKIKIKLCICMLVALKIRPTDKTFVETTKQFSQCNNFFRFKF